MEKFDLNLANKLFEDIWPTNWEDPLNTEKEGEFVASQEFLRKWFEYKNKGKS